MPRWPPRDRARDRQASEAAHLDVLRRLELVAIRVEAAQGIAAGWPPDTPAPNLSQRRAELLSLLRRPVTSRVLTLVEVATGRVRRRACPVPAALKPGQGAV